MRHPKALLPVGRDGETFLRRLLRSFGDAGADDLVVVAGAHLQGVLEEVARSPVLARVVENRLYERGQLSSLVTALDVIDRPGVVAAIVMPVDMPLVRPATIRSILSAYRQHPHPIVRPARHEAAGESPLEPGTGRHGHPVIFDRSLFAELRAADFVLGARSVVAAHAPDILDVPIVDAGAFVDIDTPEEYERWTGLRLDA